MLKQLVVIGLLGLSGMALWGSETEAWNIGNISYRPGGSYICEVEIKAETWRERWALKKGKVTVVCDQFVQQDDLHGLCQSPKGELFDSKPFDFQGQIKTRVKFRKDCEGSTCTATSVQVSTIEDVEAILDREGHRQQLPDVCNRHDTAAECIEKVFGVDSSKVCRKRHRKRHYKRHHKRRSVFYGAEFTGVNIVAIIKENDREVETLEVDCEIPGESHIEQHQDFNCQPTEHEASNEEDTEGDEGEASPHLTTR